MVLLAPPLTGTGSHAFWPGLDPASGDVNGYVFQDVIDDEFLGIWHFYEGVCGASGREVDFEFLKVLELIARGVEGICWWREKCRYLHRYNFIPILRIGLNKGIVYEGDTIDMTWTLDQLTDDVCNHL